MVAAIMSPVSGGTRELPGQERAKEEKGKELTCGGVSARGTGRAVRARVRVVGQPVVLGVARLVLLRVRVGARVLLLLLLLLGRGLAVVLLLVDNARGAGVLQMRGNRALLLVVGVVLHRGDNH